MPIWDWHAFFPFAFFPNHSFCLMKEASKNYLKANDLCLYVDFFFKFFIAKNKLNSLSIALMFDFKMFYRHFRCTIITYVTLSIYMNAHVMTSKKLLQIELNKGPMATFRFLLHNI